MQGHVSPHLKAALAKSGLVRVHARFTNPCMHRELPRRRPPHARTLPARFFDKAQFLAFIDELS